jgi:hypothetical protein
VVGKVFLIPDVFIITDEAFTDMANYIFVKWVCRSMHYGRNTLILIHFLPIVHFVVNLHAGGAALPCRTR